MNNEKSWLQSHMHPQSHIDRHQRDKRHSSKKSKRHFENAETLDQF